MRTIIRQRFRSLIDSAWQAATDSKQVPDNRWADHLIDNWAKDVGFSDDAKVEEINHLAMAEERIVFLQTTIIRRDAQLQKREALLREVRTASVLMTPSDILQRIDAVLTPASGGTVDG
jgi:hypothetical protein